MTNGWPVPSARMGAVASLLTVGLVFLPGCEDSYPADLYYPPRSDPVVIDKPASDAKRVDRPGEFPGALFVEVESGKTDAERTKDRSDQLAKLLLSPTDKQKVKPELRYRLWEDLQRFYGSPASPRIKPVNDGAAALAKKLNESIKIDNDTLALGSRVYRDQCLHCHGLSGDGRGPTAPWVNPHPRDYRQGVFKFTSSSQDQGSKRKALRDDLVRTIYEGIEGTSMPNFRLLPTEELHAVVGYVVHLSVRGETEYSALKDIGMGDLSTPDEVSARVDAYQASILSNWVEAQESQIKPEPLASMTEAERKASVQRGYKLFLNPPDPKPAGYKLKHAGCIGCHEDFGRQSKYKYDVWGTVVRPVNLTSGVYRGGQRPIDIYWRLYGGVNGSGMQAFGKKAPGEEDLNSKDIWDLVNFVQVMPFPGMRKEFQIELEGQ